MKGKNFSCNNVGQRKKSDFYETPYCLTQLLLEKEELEEPILEPACGNKAIVKVLLEKYADVEFYDIKDGQDFFDERNRYKTIITNPPYSLAFEFIQKAKTLCPNFYFLLPLSYLHGKQRYDELYNDSEYPLKQIYVFTRYPLLGEKLRKDGKTNTGMMVYAWYHFAKHYKNAPTINWLDNNEYILSSRDKI